MANGQTTQNTPFFNPDPISQQDYLSGPVDFYSQSLGQSTGIQTTDSDDDKDEDKEEITTPNIFAPVGAGQDGKEDLVMSSLAMGLEDPGSFKSFGVADVADSIKADPYTDAGLFSEQTGDLVQSFGKEFTSNIDHIKKEISSLSNFLDINLGTGVQMDKPFGKGKTSVTMPPAVGFAMGPMATTFGGLAALSGAANMAIQKQNAAIFKATGAGFIGEYNGSMVSRKPGTLMYSGNFDNKEAMAAREAIAKGFIPGTLEAEKWDGKKWGQATGKKPMLLQDGKDMRAAGGTYDPETGSFITLDGKGAAMGTMASAQAMANKVDALLGTTGLMAAEDVNTIRSQVDSNIFGTVTGKNFEQRYRDEVVSRAQTATGLSSSQINDILDGRDFSVTGSGTRGLTSKGFSTFSDFRGTSEEATGNPLDDYFSPESKAKRAANMKAEQDRRDAIAAREAREAAAKQRMEDAIARGRAEGRQDASPGDDDFDARTGAEAVRDTGGPDRTRGGRDSFYSEGGRVGMQAGGEAGFAQRPEFVGGNETPTDGQSIADDKPREVPEGSFVINAAAVDFAGREDIEKMVRKAYAKAGDMGQTGVSQEVDIAVSEGEVIIPPHIAKIIGYDRLNKINNRGKKEISRRQEERQQASGGGFIGRKKFHSGGGVDHSHAAIDPSILGGREGKEYGDSMTQEIYEEIYASPLRAQQRRKSLTPEFASKAEEKAYRQGVEFGDREVFADILGKTNFNALIQAAARDTRTLSDTVTTLRPNEMIKYPYGNNVLGLYSGRGLREYTPPLSHPTYYGDKDKVSFDERYDRYKAAQEPKITDSSIVMRSPTEFGGTAQSSRHSGSYNATLAHELMHKGADILLNIPEYSAGTVLQDIFKGLEEVGDASSMLPARKGAESAEHRYIVGVVGQAYMKSAMESALGNFEKSQRAPKGFEDSFSKLSDSDRANEMKRLFAKEMNRVYYLYLTPDQKDQLIQENPTVLAPFSINPEKHTGGFFGKAERSSESNIGFKDNVENIPLEDVAKAYQSLNRLMTEDYATQLFEKAAVKEPYVTPRIESGNKPYAPRREPSEPVYERGFLDKMLGVTPAY